MVTVIVAQMEYTTSRQSVLVSQQLVACPEFKLCYINSSITFSQGSTLFGYDESQAYVCMKSASYLLEGFPKAEQ